MSKKVIVIGGGVAGLASAGLLAKKGYSVTLIEKNARIGGRANKFEAEGYTFDMGPSWYLMPDIFEHYFQLMGTTVSDHLDLKRLDPSYRIYFAGRKDPIDIHSDIERDAAMLEKLEPGSVEKLKPYIKRGGREYALAKKSFIYRNADTIFDFFNWTTLKEGPSLGVLDTIHNFVKKRFKTPELQKILEYTMVFLGSSPYRTPALYKMMTYLDFEQGVYYPMGGFSRVMEVMADLARGAGAEIRTNAPAEQILVENGVVKGVRLEGGEVLEADLIVSNADMWFSETKLLAPEYQTYPEGYWAKKEMAPSAFILYLGVKKQLPSLLHHTFLFEEDWDAGFKELFDKPTIPTKPNLYVCSISKTDPAMAPKGKENLFILVPIAPGIYMTDEEQAAYADKVIMQVGTAMNIPNLAELIEYRRIYTAKNFGQDYNAYKGNALGGMSHLLKQTAIFRANNISKKVKGLYYAGAGTNPGIGVPIGLVSAELAYKRITGNKSHGPLDEL